MASPKNLARARLPGLLVHCFAEEKGGQWQAFSLEYGLAAQADSFPAVRKKLDAMIAAYLFEALVGEDREYGPELLQRKAAPFVYFRYHCARLGHMFRACLNIKIFREPVPLAPRACIT